MFLRILRLGHVLPKTRIHISLSSRSFSVTPTRFAGHNKVLNIRRAPSLGLTASPVVENQAPQGIRGRQKVQNLWQGSSCKHRPDDFLFEGAHPCSSAGYCICSQRSVTRGNKPVFIGTKTMSQRVAPLAQTQRRTLFWRPLFGERKKLVFLEKTSRRQSRG